MEIREAAVTDASIISALIVPLAEKFIANEFSEEAAGKLLGSLTPEAIRGYLDKGFRYHLAFDNGALVALVATRDNSHLYHLFVAEVAQSKGIAKRLWDIAKGACENAGHSGDFTVNSSRFAVGLYERLGFIQEAENDHDGVISIAMRLERTAA